MNELIDRQAAIDVGSDLIIPVDGYHMYNQAINNYCAELTNLPAVESERKTGKWILVTDNNGQHFICGQCGEWRYRQGQKFCGECGADMRERWKE